MEISELCLTRFLKVAGEKKDVETGKGVCSDSGEQTTNRVHQQIARKSDVENLGKLVHPLK